MGRPGATTRSLCAALLAGAALSLGACGGTESPEPAPVARAGRGSDPVVLRAWSRLDPGVNEEEPIWPPELRWHGAQQDVLHLALDVGRADILGLRVRDAATGAEITPGVTMRRTSGENMLVGRVGEAFPDRIDLEVDLVRHADERGARMATRGMSTVEVAGGAVRMQTVTDGIAAYEKEARSYARMTGSMASPGWSTVYVQWTSNRRSPALTPVAVSTTGDRHVLAEAVRFSTLDPIGLFPAPLAVRQIDAIEWRQFAGTETVRLRGLVLPPRSAPVEPETRFAIPFRPPGGALSVREFGTFSLEMEQHPVGAGGQRVPPSMTTPVASRTEFVLIIRGYSGPVRLVTDEPNQISGMTITSNRQHQLATASGVIIPGSRRAPSLYLEFGGE